MSSQPCPGISDDFGKFVAAEGGYLRKNQREGSIGWEADTQDDIEEPAGEIVITAEIDAAPFADGSRDIVDGKAAGLGKKDEIDRVWGGLRNRLIRDPRIGYCY